MGKACPMCRHATCAGGKIPERTLQKSSGVLRLMGIYFCNGKGKEKCSLGKEGNKDTSTVSQIQVMLTNCAKTQMVFKTNRHQPKKGIRRNG